jgi:membrane fusion protein (multidrug efflux system)
MVKRIIIAAILIVLIGGGLVGFNLFRSQGIKEYFATMPRPTLTVSTIAVQPVTWYPTIDAIGTVSAATGVDLAVELAGIIRQVNFKANDDITAGQLLIQIDDRTERADLAAVEATLANDQQTLERTRQLRERGVNSAVTLENAQTAVAASQAQVDRLKAVLDQKSIEAPFSGTIGIPRIEVGQYVEIGAVVATLQDLSLMRVDFTVPEQDFNRLSIGQNVHVSDAVTQKVYEGRVTGIDPKIDPATRLISVRAEIETADRTLQPGQFVRVAVVLQAQENVIALPQTAVVTSLYGDYVFAVTEAPPPAAGAPAEPAPATPNEGGAPAPAAKPLEAKQIFVKIGRRSGGFIEITGGVSAGQQIVTAGQNRLTNGTPVTVDNTVDPVAAIRQPDGAP